MFCLCVYQIGLRGATVLASSGDEGVIKQDMSTCRPFSACFPASSPHILTIGATQLLPATGTATKNCRYVPSDAPDANCLEEVACSGATGCIITSGGGFSNF